MCTKKETTYAGSKPCQPPPPAMLAGLGAPPSSERGGEL